MEKIVIIGAFDRYNYGDNLMPILFERFLARYYPNVLDNFELVFAALTTSDLSRYKVKKTESLKNVFANKRDDRIHSIICIGGEVLCSSSSTLFLHMDDSDILRKIVRLLKNLRMSLLTDWVCRGYYRLPWEYPYIPKKCTTKTKVALNTVGGRVPTRSIGPFLSRIRKRLIEADYVSVRDTRTEASVSDFCSPKLLPDSAILMADFVTDQFLVGESGARVNELRSSDYICFQAAPKKVGATAKECSQVLWELSYKHGLKVVLCPIGYANGHDDVEFLREVNKESGFVFELLHDLNIWEIMSVIKNSRIFIGTSLHGIITALSFSVPHIGLNKRVVKLDRFLNDWSIGPLNQCYSIEELRDVFGNAIAINRSELAQISLHLRNLGHQNNHGLVKALAINA